MSGAIPKLGHNLLKVAAAVATLLVASSLSASCGQNNSYVPPPPPRVTVALPQQRTITRYILAGMLAIAQSSKPQTTNSAHVHAKNLDRCPYYPSPVFCRLRAGDQNQLGRDADSR